MLSGWFRFPQTGNHRFRHVFLRNYIHFQPMLFDGVFGGRADRGNFQVAQVISVEPKIPQPPPESFDSVDAGEDEPIIGGEILKCSVQLSVRARFAYFDERDFEHLRAEITQAGGESAGLVPSTTDDGAQAF